MILQHLTTTTGGILVVFCFYVGLHTQLYPVPLKKNRLFSSYVNIVPVKKNAKEIPAMWCQLHETEEEQAVAKKNLPN